MFRQHGANRDSSLDLAAVVGGERCDDVRVEGNLAAGALCPGGGSIDWPRRAWTTVVAEAAIGPDHDDSAEAGRRCRGFEVEMVPAQRAERASPCSGDDGELEEQGEPGIDLFGFGQELDNVHVGRRFDLFFEDLAGLGVLGRVAADPAPLHRLAER